MARDQQTNSAYWVAVTVLVFETAVAAIVLLFAASTRWPVGMLSEERFGRLGQVLYPAVAAGLWFLLLRLVTAAVVLPMLTAARWLGRRIDGRPDAWWWVPATASAVALLVPAYAAVCGAGPRTVLLSWTIAAAALTGATAAAHLALTERWRLRSRLLTIRTVEAGGAAVVLALALGTTVFATGLAHAYAPPHLSAALLNGTWTDGRGGTLTLAADGTATAVSIEVSREDADRTQPCSGPGTWSYDAGRDDHDDHDQSVRITVADCPDADLDWKPRGTPEYPELYRYLGDPDEGRVATLRKRP